MTKTTIFGNKHNEQTRDGDFYTHRLVIYSDAWGFPRECSIDEYHTYNAYHRAKGMILEHEDNIGKVNHAWLTRVDATCTDSYHETVFVYEHGRWMLY